MLTHNAKAAKAGRRGGAESLPAEGDERPDGQHGRPGTEEFEPGVPSPTRPGTLLGRLRKRGAAGGQANGGRENPFAPTLGVGSPRPR